MFGFPGIERYVHEMVKLDGICNGCCKEKLKCAVGNYILLARTTSRLPQLILALFNKVFCFEVNSGNFYHLIIFYNDWLFDNTCKLVNIYLFV